MVKQFTKPALSLDEQLDLLESRGLKIEDRTWAKARLRRIGYYRLSAYGLPLQYDDSARAGLHLFKPGSSFGLILRLYEFDRQLRLLVFDAVERVEVSARGCISNTLGLSHGPHWFMDQAHFTTVQFYTEFCAKLDDEFGRANPRKPKGDVFIQHYYRTYRDPIYPPTWMLSEALSLGTWSMVYEYLTAANQKLVAQHFGLHYTNVTSWLRALTVIRNLCAHHSRLWNRAFTAIPAIPVGLITKPVVPARFAAQAVVIFALLRRSEPQSNWGVRLSDLLDRYPEVDPLAMGFPVGWTADPFWNFPPPHVEHGSYI